MDAEARKPSFSRDDMDLDGLEAAINAGDGEALRAVIAELSARAEENGTRLFTFTAITWVLSELYSRGGRIGAGRCTEETFLAAFREVSGCSDIPSAFAVLERFCLTLSSLDGRPAPRDADRQAYIRRAVEYMRRSYGNPGLRLEEVAQYAYISTSYLTLLIKCETGKTFSQLLTEIRMEQALHMLLETDRRAYEISSRCGFANSTYFSTVFRKCYGMTPTEYRRRMRDESELAGATKS